MKKEESMNHSDMFIYSWAYERNILLVVLIIALWLYLEQTREIQCKVIKETGLKKTEVPNLFPWVKVYDPTGKIASAIRRRLRERCNGIWLHKRRFVTMANSHNDLSYLRKTGEFIELIQIAETYGIDTRDFRWETIYLHRDKR